MNPASTTSCIIVEKSSAEYNPSLMSKYSGLFKIPTTTEAVSDCSWSLFDIVTITRSPIGPRPNFPEFEKVYFWICVIVGILKEKRQGPY